MTESVNRVFTIGYATLGIDRFIHLLRQHDIAAVADVRSQPYSRYTPEYSQDQLKAALAEAGIQYVFMGKELGARRDEPQCYVDGKVRYDLVARTTAFPDGTLESHEELEQRLLQLHGRDQVDLFEGKTDDSIAPIRCRRRRLPSSGKGRSNVTLS
jgi:hypothetical protein